MNELTWVESNNKVDWGEHPRWACMTCLVGVDADFMSAITVTRRGLLKGLVDYSWKYLRQSSLNSHCTTVNCPTLPVTGIIPSVMVNTWLLPSRRHSSRISIANLDDLTLYLPLVSSILSLERARLHYKPALPTGNKIKFGITAAILMVRGFGSKSADGDLWFRLECGKIPRPAFVPTFEKLLHIRKSLQTYGGR